MHHRNILPHVVAAMNSSPAVLLLGPSRTEKTSLALAAAAGLGIRCFMDLDDPRTLAAVRLNPARALSSGPVLVVAIERVPGLLKALAPAIERSGRQTGSVLLVGSVDVLDEEFAQIDGLSVIRVADLESLASATDCLRLFSAMRKRSNHLNHCAAVLSPPAHTETTHSAMFHASENAGPPRQASRRYPTIRRARLIAKSRLLCLHDDASTQTQDHESQASLGLWRTHR